MVLILFLLFVEICRSQSLSQMIDNKEAAVKGLANLVGDAYSGRCSKLSDCPCSYSSCESEMANPVCIEDAHLDHCGCEGMSMDLSNSVVRVAKGVDENDDHIKETICFSKEIDSDFAAVEKEDKTMEWQGFGSVHGIFRIYPGRPQDKCGAYDPRIRSWYVAASSGPKDVIIILDRSSSMMGNRWELAVEAVKTILKTLTISDFVSIVLFSGGTESQFDPVVLGDEARLYRATAEARQMFNDALDDSDPLGATDYGAGFEKAFELLEYSRSIELGSNCQTAILFLTDGEITFGLGKTDPDELYDFIAGLNLVHNAVIFTYSLGDSASHVIPQQISCRNNGIWQYIQDGGNVVSQMSLFYYYFSLGIAKDSLTNPRAVWVEPYEFATAGTLGTSVSSPVYSYATDPPQLLGVVGTGFSLKEMEKVEPDPEALLEELISRAGVCPNFEMNECRMEALRNWFYVESGTELPIGITSAMCNETKFTNDCEAHEELLPSKCTGVTKSGKNWCNQAYPGGNDEAELWNDRVCCKCGIDTAALVGIILGATTAVVIVLVVIIGGFVLVYVYTQVRGKWKENERELKRKTRELEEKDRQLAEANQGGGQVIVDPTGIPLSNPGYNPGYAPTAPEY